MKNVILAIVVLFVTGLSQAQEKKNKNAKYEFEVNGHCEQCQKRIEKAAFSVPGVKSAVWSAEDHILKLIINEEKCSVLDVKKAVAKAGHDAAEVKADATVYENLPGCCQYDRK